MSAPDAMPYVREEVCAERVALAVDITREEVLRQMIMEGGPIPTSGMCSVGADALRKSLAEYENVPFAGDVYRYVVFEVWQAMYNQFQQEKTLRYD